MKRAPVIPNIRSILNRLEISRYRHQLPMVDSLIARVGVMARGNAITLPVCGRDVKFTLRSAPG